MAEQDKKTLTQQECFAQLKAMIAPMQEDIAYIKEQIDGNGHAGLKEQAMLNTSHRERMEKIIDGLWLKVLFIWASSMATIAALIKFLGGQ